MLGAGENQEVKKWGIPLNSWGGETRQFYFESFRLKWPGCTEAQNTNIIFPFMENRLRVQVKNEK